MRTDETWMEADIHQLPILTENARCLAQKSLELIHVRMRERRENSFEGPICEWQRARVRLDELHLITDSLPGKAELIGRDVDSRHGPAQLEQGGNVQPGPATEVEAVPPSPAEQASNRLARGERESGEILVIPVGVPVVARPRHRFDDATGCRSKSSAALRRGRGTRGSAPREPAIVKARAPSTRSAPNSCRGQTHDRSPPSQARPGTSTHRCRESSSRSTPPTPRRCR